MPDRNYFVNLSLLDFAKLKGAPGANGSSAHGQVLPWPFPGTGEMEEAGDDF